MFFNLLVESGLVDDDVVTIEQVLLQFVGQNTFQRLAFVSFSNLTNNVSDVVVGVTSLEGSEGTLEGVVGSEDDISLSSFNSLGTNNDSVGSNSDETVNVDTEVAIER